MIQKFKDEDLRLDFIRFSELLLIKRRPGGKTCLARIQTKSTFDEIPTQMLLTPAFRSSMDHL
jgi:hypothetical protein